MESELPLSQHDWIDHMRQRVGQLSDGRIGYVYLSNFNELGSEDFIRQFHPQLDKEGLVFDVRWNRSGFTSQSILDVLRRGPAGMFVNREDAVTPLPGVVAPHAMVTIINQFSALDGDEFPY